VYITDFLYQTYIPVARQSDPTELLPRSEAQVNHSPLAARLPSPHGFDCSRRLVIVIENRLMADGRTNRQTTGHNIRRAVHRRCIIHLSRAVEIHAAFNDHRGGYVVYATRQTVWVGTGTVMLVIDAIIRIYYLPLTGSL